MNRTLALGFVASVSLSGLLIGGARTPSSAIVREPAAVADVVTTRAATGVAEKLQTKISVAGWNLDPLPKTLDAFLRPRGIEYSIDQEAFTRSGIDPAKRLVTYAPMKDVTVGTVLKNILDQVPAKYRIEGEKLIILPRP